MSAKYTYSIESYSKALNKWTRFIKDETKDFCLGYLQASASGSMYPRRMRVVRSDGVLVREILETDELPIGMIAGWPTPEQYEAAAQQALDHAKAIRELKQKYGL